MSRHRSGGNSAVNLAGVFSGILLFLAAFAQWTSAPDPKAANIEATRVASLPTAVHTVTFGWSNQPYTVYNGYGYTAVLPSHNYSVNTGYKFPLRSLGEIQDATTYRMAIGIVENMNPSGDQKAIVCVSKKGAATVHRGTLAQDGDCDRGYLLLLAAR